jgi:outer membrane protein
MKRGLLAVTMAAALGAAMSTAPARAQDLKVAFVDFQRIQAQYPDFQRAQEEFDKDVDQWKQELAALEEEITNSENEFEKQKLLLSEDKRAEREKVITDKKLQYQQLSTSILGPGGRADTRQKALLEGILKKVNDAMALVASKENYAVIFEKAALAYAQEKLDVTDKVLQELERMQ